MKVHVHAQYWTKVTQQGTQHPNKWFQYLL